MKKLDISREEKKAISVYLSDRKASLMMLSNFDPINYVKQYKEGQILYGNPENENEIADGKERFREDIDNFVNIYAAMYKTMLQRKINGDEENVIVYRGDTNSNIKEYLGKNRKLLVTHKDKKEAAKECGKDPVIIEFTINDNVPYLDITKDKFSDATTEEVIIAPFSHVDSIEFENADSKIHYNGNVVRKELADIPKDDITNNRRAVTNGFMKNIRNMFEYDSLENKKTAEADELFNSMIVYKGKLLSMLEGMCKEKEKELDQKYKEQKGEIDAQNQKQAFDKYRRVRNQSLEIFKNMYNDVYALYANMTDDQRKYEDKAETYGVKCDEKIDANQCNNIIKHIYTNEKQYEKEIEDLNITTESQAEDIDNAEQLLRPKLEALVSLYVEKTEEFKTIRAYFARNSEKVINKNLYNKVFKLIKENKISKIKESKKQVEEEKIGFFGKLFGREKLRREKIKNFDLQIKLEEKRMPEERLEYSIMDILSDMYAYELMNNPSERVNELLNQNGNKITEEVLKELENGFNPEMKKINDQIFYNEKDLELIDISETTAQASNNYSKANLPMPVTGKKIKTKVELDYFKQINGYLQTEIEKVDNNKTITNDIVNEDTNSKFIKILANIENRTGKLVQDEVQAKGIEESRDTILDDKAAI